MAKRPKSYTNERITVTYDIARCMHAAECVRGLPAVFDTKKRPWVDPSAGDAEEIAKVVMRCPSGALKFERHDGGPPEPAPVSSVRAVRNGPLYVRGDVTIETESGVVREYRMALCRCGHSANKPFCDGTHASIGFQAP